MISILIIEDNRYMREGWETFINFEDDMEVVGSYDSCEAAFSEKKIEKSTIILMDIGLPGMSGIEGVIHVKKHFPHISVIMATVYDDDDHIFNSLKAGADGYLMKKSTPEELIKAIRDVESGGSPLTPNVAKKVLKSLFLPKNDEVKLTEREQQILKELSTGKSYAAIGKKVFL
jgi:DNA-binding NarL/FixJ family response regulator